MSAIKGNQNATSRHMDSVHEYLPLVKKIAKRIARRLPEHVMLEDLLSAGAVGLLEAMSRYDSTKSVEFSSYAEFRIKGAILDELRKRDLMARDARTESKKIEEVIYKLTQFLGRQPQEEEIAQELGLTLNEWHEKIEKIIPVNVVELEEHNYFKQSQNFDAPDDISSKREILMKLEKALNQLSEKYQTVLWLYYFEDLTLKEIGKVLDVTESRICQIINTATLQLRTILKKEEIQEA